MSHTTRITRTKMISGPHLQAALDTLGITYEVDADFHSEGMSETVAFLVTVPKVGSKIGIRERNGAYEVLSSSRTEVDLERFSEALHRQYVYEVTDSSMRDQGFVLESDLVNDKGERVVVYVEAGV